MLVYCKETNMQLLIATQNQTKVDRIRDILNSFEHSIELLSLKEFDIPEPDEPYDTFIDNALHKAKYYCKKTGVATLSEDSGLCINALNGFPGVRTKEFREFSGGITEACLDLQARLQSFSDHSAYFVSAACVIQPQVEDALVAEGRLEGDILLEPFKDHGFDFERIFVPKGIDITLAEMATEDKNKISHRYKAIHNIYMQLVASIEALQNTK